MCSNRTRSLTSRLQFLKCTSSFIYFSLKIRIGHNNTYLTYPISDPSHLVELTHAIMPACAYKYKTNTPRWKTNVNNALILYSYRQALILPHRLWAGLEPTSFLLCSIVVLHQGEGISSHSRVEMRFRCRIVR